jgi:hypothetical protein
MAVKRQKHWLGQQRVDTTHLREVESAVVGDFDDLAGKILASSQPIVVSGMTIAMGAAVGNFATQLVLNTAGAILLHGSASEPGALFVVPTTQPAETLSTSNPHVAGSFTPNAINYIGIDLIRSVDDATADTVKFRSATTKKEFSQQVPLARTLQYSIVISPQDFSQTPNVAPVAEVQLDANGVVQSVTDCRQMMFRLGTGGSVPNPLAPYAWPGGRVENPVTSTTTNDPFSGADKSIPSFIEFFHAMESRLWEVGGGEHWYSQTTDRDVLFIRDSTNVFVSNGENFEWTGTNIHWKALSFDFGNSTATRNTINDQTVDSPGLTDLAVGQCIFVDLDRAVDAAALTAQKANLSTIGTPTIPGSRHIIAWRTVEGVFGLGQSTPVGFATVHASDTVFGTVKLFTPFTPSPGNPVVPVMDADSATVLANPATQANVVARGITRDSAGTLRIGPGAFDTALLFALSGVISTFNGPISGLEGISALGVGTTPAIVGTSSGIAGSYGVHGIGTGNNYGVRGDGGTAAGVYGLGGSTFAGVVGQGGASAMGVYGLGGSNAEGGRFEGAGTGSGVLGISGGTTGHGVAGQAGTSGAGVRGYSTTAADAVQAENVGSGPCIRTMPGGSGPDMDWDGRSTFPAAGAVNPGWMYFDTVEKAPFYSDGASNPWQQMGEHVVMLTSDQSTTSAAMSDVTTLAFPVAAGQRYEFEVIFIAQTADAAGFAAQFTGPAIGGGIIQIGGLVVYGTNAYGQGTTAFSTPFNLLATSLGLAATFIIKGSIVTDATAGTVQMQWRSNTGGGGNTSTVKAGSYIKWRRVGP